MFQCLDAGADQVSGYRHVGRVPARNLASDSPEPFATIDAAEVDEMSDETYKQPAGWYYAQGDPPGTQRYWDGNMWQGDAQPVPGGNTFGSSETSGTVPAEPGRRNAARLIDVGVWIAIGLLVAVPSGIMMAVSNSDDLIQTVGQFVAGIVIVLYEFAMVSAAGGTVGKRLLGLTVTATAGSVDTQVTLRRVALLLVYVLLAGIPVVGFVLLVALPIAGLVMIFADSNNRQTPWDKLAGTVVTNG